MQPSSYLLFSPIEKKKTLKFGTTSVTESEQALNNIAQQTGMTPGGADFLIANLDPFHDNQLRYLSGWPDTETAASVIRVIKQSITLKAPASAGTGNWDAQFVLWPWLDLLDLQLVGRNFGGRILNSNTGSNPQATFGGLNVYTKTSSPLPFAWATDYSGAIVLDQAYSQGIGRLIGIGFEVTNTTAELYRQGLATVYRQAMPYEDTGVWLQTSTTQPQSFIEMKSYRQPPLNSAEALLYPGSRQWRADEGCYMVAPFVGNENPPQTVTYMQPIVMTDDDKTSAVNTSSVWAPTPTYQSISPEQVAGYRGTKHYPIHLVGAIFEGLSNQTTLTVNLNIIYESFPSVSEKDILVLAKPSCMFDPVALSALSEVLATLPVGVPAKMNASGDWFYDLVSTIEEYAPKFGELIPGGGLIGKGIGSAAGLAKSYLTPPGDTSVKQVPTQVSEARKKKRENLRNFQARKQESAALRQEIKPKKPSQTRKGNQKRTAAQSNSNKRG